MSAQASRQLGAGGLVTRSHSQHHTWLTRLSVEPDLTLSSLLLLARDLLPHWPQKAHRILLVILKNKTKKPIKKPTPPKTTAFLCCSRTGAQQTRNQQCMHRKPIKYCCPTDKRGKQQILFCLSPPSSAIKELGFVLFSPRHKLFTLGELQNSQNFLLLFLSVLQKWVAVGKKKKISPPLTYRQETRNTVTFNINFLMSWEYFKKPHKFCITWEF